MMYQKMHPVFCTNTHHDVTCLLNHVMVKNTKTWISWEWNKTFLWNKKILNLCLQWHILRNYHFVVEVTFNFFKGYLCYKTIFCHKVALDAQLLNFFIWSKNNASVSRYLDFCAFAKSTDFKICDAIISIAT